MTTREKVAAGFEPPLAGLRRGGRLILPVLLGAGIAVAWRWRAALDPTAIGAAIAAYPATPLVFLGVHVAASLLFVPRTVLAIAAGLLFGMGWGVVWAALGSVLGAVAGFCVARYVSDGVVDLEQQGPHPAGPRSRPAGWLARRGAAAVDPGRAAQPRQLRPRSDANPGRPLRLWLSCRPIADDHRLRRPRRRRRAAGDRRGGLGHADRDRRRRTRALIADSDRRRPPGRIAGGQ